MSKVIISNNKALLKQNGKIIVDLDLPADYIQDGLVFYLDGIDKGGDNNYWTDLVGGVKFEYNEHSIKENDGIRFDGNGMLIANKNFGVAHTDGTIETAYYQNVVGYGIIISPTNQINLGIALGKSGISYAYGTNPETYANEFLFSKTRKATASFSDSLALYNGTQQKNKRNNRWVYSIGTPIIAGRNYKVPYYFSGYIYTIRIYNRVLTEQEMLHNQKIDNERFNLGLNI